jgi:hypothetical protein
MDRSTPDRPHVYEILVQGKLDRDWSDWLDGLSIAMEDADGGETITRLTGLVADQPALRGILTRVWDLNLVILSIRQLE